MTHPTHSLSLPLAIACLIVFATGQAHALDLAWPTPNRAFLEGHPLEVYIQPTVSGVVTSGIFGCVRSNGTQFHEGLDLFPLNRDARGEAVDPIFAVLPGVVRYINTRVGDSSYGRYIVLEHPEQTPGVYTLYAHLSAIVSGLAAGDRVASGQRIGTMGRSAGGYSIPRERAHLHFEIGLRATDDFQSWYDFRKFGSPNRHGNWSGMNLMGFDALDFFTQYRDRQIGRLADYFAGMEAAVRVRIATSRFPDFVARYPGLLTQPLPIAGAAGWEISFSTAGLPFAWTPLAPADVAGYRVDEIRIVEVDETRVRACRCKSLVVARRGGHGPGRDLETVMQQVFGLR